MALTDTLVRWITGRQPQRSYPALSLEDWISYFTYNSHQYPFTLNQSFPSGETEEIRDIGLVQGGYKGNSIVFACILVRMQLFSEARFQWQRMVKGRPGDLFGTADLDILEHPEPGKVTGDLLTRAILDADLYGNHFLTRRFDDGVLRLKRLEPPWVTIILGSQSDPDLDSRDIDAEVIGYGYQPGGKGSGIPPEFLLREQVAHFAPVPDPTAHYRGMSWLTPLIREIQSDTAATTHKELFFRNAATPNVVISRPDSPEPQLFNQWVDMIEEGHTGLANAFKTIYLTAGQTATAIGSNMQQMEFKATQGAGETRIAAAAGVHPVIVGLSEGLQGSSLNQGNFMAARRLMADRTLRPLWRNLASSLEVIVPPPSGARLWYDDRHIPFLAEDVKEQAEVQGSEAQTIRTLLDGGWLAESVKAAVLAHDWSLLEHSGLFSVQLQPPGPPVSEPTNGKVADPESVIAEA